MQDMPCVNRFLRAPGRTLRRAPTVPSPSGKVLSVSKSARTKNGLLGGSTQSSAYASASIASAVAASMWSFCELELDLAQGPLNLVALLEIESGLAFLFAYLVISLTKLGEEDRAAVNLGVVAGPVREDLRDSQRRAWSFK